MRYNATLRDMLAEVRLCKDEFIAPLFVRAGSGVKREIKSMPGQFQFSVDTAVETVRRWADRGLRAVLLFGVTDEKDKDESGSMAWCDDAPVQTLTREIKHALPDMLVVADTCLCEYTSHGHCGPLTECDCGKFDVDNDAALACLARAAVSQSRAGADIVAPSAMMDNQVLAIRTALDEAGMTRTAIMSYSVKFASCMYGPFRDAAESPPKSGDRKTYQMDFRSPRQYLAELREDESQGADIVMVKPAATYLDIIAQMRAHTALPVAAYHVSGEYAQIKFAAQAGAIDERAAVIETMSAIKRAGADIIITYYAEALADWLG